MMRLVRRANQVKVGDRVVTEEGVVTVTEVVHDDRVSIMYYAKPDGEWDPSIGTNYRCSVVAWPNEWVDVLL